MTVERFVDNSVEISQVSGYDNLKNLFQQTVGDLIDSVDDYVKVEQQKINREKIMPDKSLKKLKTKLKGGKRKIRAEMETNNADKELGDNMRNIITNLIQTGDQMKDMLRKNDSELKEGNDKNVPEK